MQQLQFRMHKKAAGAGIALLASCLFDVAFAQANMAPQAIYSCVDAKGRRLTADRPIAECMDRTQQQLSPSGLVRRELAPSLTAPERAALEEKEKAAVEARAREAEDKKRDRALLTRYPTRAEHDKERAAALLQVDEVIKTSTTRSRDLAEQRKAINADYEFYKANPGRAPASLKRRLDENDAGAAAQKRFVAEQEQEKKRVNMRFDEEVARLKPLWAMAGVVPANVMPASTAKK
ncbi:MAG: DUF4124 domain-containing protein [Polaromonas sp.]|nr:DUF4124 domain-containing protein [Polaromonas sp.]